MSHNIAACNALTLNLLPLSLVGSHMQQQGSSKFNKVYRNQKEETTFLHAWNLLSPLISSPLRPFPMLRADAAACKDNSCAGLVVIVIVVVGERAVNVRMAMVAVAVVVW